MAMKRRKRRRRVSEMDLRNALRGSFQSALAIPSGEQAKTKVNQDASDIARTPGTPLSNSRILAKFFGSPR